MAIGLNLQALQKASSILREQLQKEMDTRHDINLELGVGVALSDYVKWQHRLEEIQIELRGLDVINAVLSDMAQRAEQEKQALEAAQAQRKQQANELFQKLNSMEFGPEHSIMLAELALLTK